MLIPLSEVIRKLSFLPGHGYETLMKIRRTEMREKPDKQPINPGEEIEVYNDGKWTKIKWPKN